MNLYRIGDTVLNLDRVNGIQDRPPGPDAAAAAGHAVIRVLFDTTTLTLEGAEAESFRRWFRHAAQNLIEHKDENGEGLIAPEEQLKRVSALLVSLIDRARPRDPAARHFVHHLAAMIDQYITGELRPVPARRIEKLLEQIPTTSAGSSGGTA
jgi:hypothetical protein